MEFIITTDYESALPTAINFNDQELEQQLTVSLQKYNDLVVPEDGIREAKGDLATLRRLRTAIEDKRKEVKKSILRPYEDFEMKTKRLTGMIDEAISNIDIQVKEYNEIQKQQKYEEINQFYEKRAGKLTKLISLNQIINPKWANAGMSVKAVQDELEESIQRIENDMDIISGMDSAFVNQIMDVYLHTLDMSSAIAEKTRLEAQQQALEAMQEKQPEEKPVPVKPIMPEIPNPDENLKTIKVIFYDTTEEFRAEMKALTQRHGIKYGGIQ